MFAAKAGHSTLGIPQSVGADFANADPGGKLPARVSGGKPVAHRPSSSMEAMTGMPTGKRKVRRGGGRHKAASSSIHINPKHKGELHSDLGVPQGQPIPLSKIHAAEHSANPAVRKRAVFADNAKTKFHHAAAQHANDAIQHIASGNHAAAKKSAFHLVRALHAISSQAAPSALPSAPSSAPSSSDTPPVSVM